MRSSLTLLIRRSHRSLELRTFASEADLTPTATSIVESTSGSCTENNGPGVLSKLWKILGEAETPLTSDQVWELAEKEGVRSKTHMKLMLSQMKQRGNVSTMVVASENKKKGKKPFGYYLTDKSEYREEDV
jgi:hypothetical protein